MQLNPWLFPVLGLTGLTLAALPFFNLFAIPAQVLALPLPVYLGALLYVAWNDVFQGGAEEEEIVELRSCGGPGSAARQCRANLAQGEPQIFPRRKCSGGGHQRQNSGQPPDR